MTKTRKAPAKTQKQLVNENKNLHARLDEAEETLRAIRDGEVDALIISSANGEQVVTIKQVEEALRLSEEKYRTLVDEVTDGLYVTDTAGVFTFANPALAHIYGVETPQELVGKKFLDFVVPEMLEELAKLFRHTLETGDASEVLYVQIVRRDGKVVFVEVKPASMIMGGQTVGSRGVVRDITERMQAEEALRASEERFRSLYENVPTGIYRTSIDGHILLANPALIHMLGYDSFDDLTHLNLEQNGNGPELPRTEFHQRLDRDAEISGLETAWKKKDGTVFFVHENARLITDKNGANLYYEGTVEDITERKLAEERVKRQLDHLTALSSIDQVIASNFDLKMSLSEILTHVTTELGVDATSILTLNSSSQLLEFCVCSGFRSQTKGMAPIRLGESHAGRAALERHLVHIPDLSKEPNDSLLKDNLSGEDFVCYFGVPLITKGQVMGVMEVLHRAPLEPDPEWFDFLNALAGRAAIAIENATLFESQQRSNSELTLAYNATIEGWSHALDLRDRETEGHTQRVAEMSVKLARAFGLSGAELVQVRWGALLHDIGKMGVPDGILLKPGPLTDSEWVVMKMHPTFAFDMLSPIRYLRQALEIPYGHHEKWDGSGYPHGLKGTQIPLTARIFAVVDVWDALNSDRPYRSAWMEDKVREHILASSGTHFDPEVVNVFMKSLK